MNEKILFLIGSLEVGGAEQHVVRVTKGLQERGWSPHVFSFYVPGPLEQDLEQAGIPIHGRPLAVWVAKYIKKRRTQAKVRLLMASIALLRLLWCERFSAVHFYLPATYIMGGGVSHLAPVGARIMSRRSRNHYQEKHPLLGRLERRLHKRMDAVCGNSKPVIEDLAGEGVDERRLNLIYNGIDVARFDAPLNRDRLRRSLGFHENEILVICVANLIPYKGHADLIEALGRVAEQLHGSWRLLCVGRDDGLEEPLRALSKEVGISERVSFLGSRNDVDRLMRIADVGVLASHEEGFSNAVLEKMAAALPVVVTDVGGNSEVVENGKTGYIVSPNHPESLAVALLEIMNMPEEERKRIGKTARRRVEERFSMGACLDAYENLYRKVIKK